METKTTSTTKTGNTIEVKRRKIDGSATVKQNKTLDISKNGATFPSFQKPIVQGYFSVNKRREFEPTSKLLKYLHIKNSMKVSFDLNFGIDGCIRKNHPPELLKHIFNWLNHHNYIVNEEISSQLNDVIICFRGLLTTIMCTPYEDNEGWIICAKQINKTIFLCAFDTEEKLEHQQNETERQKQMCSWGYKFEQYMLSDHPKAKPDTNKPVNENEEFCCLFSSKLKGQKLLYAAEMDGIISEYVIGVNEDQKSMQNARFVELKTNRIIENNRQDRNFRRFKMLKWWCQSFLVGIETIMCGFRDDTGLVTNVEDFSVKSLPKYAKGLWEPNVCMNFCVEFLGFVKNCLIESPKSTWKFQWNPRDLIKAHDLSNDQSYSFVPNWLKESVEDHI